MNKKKKLLDLVKDADVRVRDIEVAFPKSQNKVNGLRWTLKTLREEISKEEVVKVEGQQEKEES